LTWITESSCAAIVSIPTQASGPTLVHDWLYELRLFALEQLSGMGADLFLCDPHRIIGRNDPSRGYVGKTAHLDRRLPVSIEGDTHAGDRLCGGEQERDQHHKVNRRRGRGMTATPPLQITISLRRGS